MLNQYNCMRVEPVNVQGMYECMEVLDKLPMREASQWVEQNSTQLIYGAQWTMTMNGTMSDAGMDGTMDAKPWDKRETTNGIMRQQYM